MTDSRLLEARLGTILNIAEGGLTDKALPEIARLAREALRAPPELPSPGTKSTLTSKESPTVQMLRMWLTNWEASLRAYDKRCAGPLDELHLIVDSAPAPETLPQQLSPSGPSTSTTLLERASLAGAGRQLSETPAFTVEELMHEIHAAHAHTMWRNMPDGRSVPNLCQCRFCKSMGPNALKANEPREWHFDRYRGGRLMAESASTFALTEEEARERVKSRYPPGSGDVFKLRDEKNGNPQA